MNCIQWWRKN